MAGTGSEHELPALRPRARLSRLLRDLQWWFIAAAGAVAALLGFVGFQDLSRATGGATGFWDLSYRTLQLFTLESGAVTDGAAVPPTLNVARFLAPVVTAGALVRATLSLFREQAQLVRLRLMRDHVVVCGTGSKGLALARSLHEQGLPVVAVERDAESDSVVTCRSAGIPVLIGDATDPDVLAKANLGRAAYIVTLCGESGTNAQITAVAHAVPRRHGRPLTCLVHLLEPNLSSLLRARFPAAGTDADFRVEFFDIYERAARVLLQRHPAFERHPSVSARPHLLVAGLGRLGRSVVVQAARSWAVADLPPDAELRVTVVDIDPAVRLGGLLTEHPEVGNACTIDLVHSLADVTGPTVDTAYVCIGDEAEALLVGLTLHQELAPGATVVVRSNTDEGLPHLLRMAGSEFEGLHGFAMLDQTCDAELLLGGFTEQLAQLLHARWVAKREAQGWEYGDRRDAERRTHPALTSWSDLAEETKDANRDQAAHTWAKLAAVGCELVELTDWETARFQFDEAELETLAQLEHRRWLERQALRDGSGRHGRGVVHEDLVPWADLAEEEREVDREFVRALPALLTQLGYQVARRAVGGQSEELRRSKPS